MSGVIGVKNRETGVKCKNREAAMSPLVFPARSRLLLRSRWWTGASRRTFCATRAARMASKGKWDIEVAMKEGPPLRLGFGKLAKMADGACVASMGSTSVLTTSVCPQPESGTGCFHSLSVA